MLTDEIKQSQGGLSYAKRYRCKLAMYREWRALEQCKGPLIQKIIAVDDNALTLWFEFDLHAKPLTAFSAVDLPLFIELFPKIVNSITHCHEQGWVHGDIKPANILYLEKEHTIRLIDFGASYPIATCRLSLLEWQFTPMFASPAQRGGFGLVDPSDDWYAVHKIIEPFISCGAKRPESAQMQIFADQMHHKITTNKKDDSVGA